VSATAHVANVHAADRVERGVRATATVPAARRIDRPRQRFFMSRGREKFADCSVIKWHETCRGDNGEEPKRSTRMLRLQEESKRR